MVLIGPRPAGKGLPPRSPSSTRAGKPRDGVIADFGRKRSIVFPPSRLQPTLPLPLGAGLIREHVYGVNGSPLHTLHVLRDRRILYIAARLCIMTDLGTGAQTYFEGHSADVLSVDYCPARDLAVSGQQDPLGPECAPALLWCPATPERPIAELRLFVDRPPRALERASRLDVEMLDEVSLQMITAVAVAPHGRTVMIGADDEHKTICIYELPEAILSRERLPEQPYILKRPTYTCSSGRLGFTAAFANPCDIDNPNHFRFVTTHGQQLGTGMMRFWDYRNGGEVTVSNAIFGKSPTSSLTWCSFSSNEGSYLASGSKGHLYMFSANKCLSQSLLTSGKVPLTCVASLANHPTLDFVATSGDGEIVLGHLSEDSVAPPGKRRRLGHRPQIDGRFFLDQIAGGDKLPAGLRPRWNNLKLLEENEGTALLLSENHFLVLVDLGIISGHNRNVMSIVQVGFRGECWALAHHPTMKGLCASGDTIGVLRFWDTGRKRPLTNKTYKNDYPIMCMAFSETGDLLALGQGEGMVDVLRFPSLERVLRKRICHSKDGKGHFEEMSDVKFSSEQAEGCFLAFACWDQKIYLFRVLRSERRRKDFADDKDDTRVILHKTLVGNSSSPTHIMFTSDGQYLVSNSKDCQILLWRTANGERIPSMAVVRDSAFPQWTCVLGWPVAGCWKSEYDLTDINALCQTSQPLTNGSHYVAVADDNHSVVLYRFPAHSVACEHRDYTGHSSHVTNLRFNSENVLISAGGNDHTLMQWRIHEDQEAGEELQLGISRRPVAQTSHRWSGLPPPAPQPLALQPSVQSFQLPLRAQQPPPTGNPRSRPVSAGVGLGGGRFLSPTAPGASRTPSPSPTPMAAPDHRAVQAPAAVPATAAAAAAAAAAPTFVMGRSDASRGCRRDLAAATEASRVLDMLGVATPVRNSFPQASPAAREGFGHGSPWPQPTDVADDIEPANWSVHGAESPSAMRGRIPAVHQSDPSTTIPNRLPRQFSWDDRLEQAAPVSYVSPVPRGRGYPPMRPPPPPRQPSAIRDALQGWPQDGGVSVNGPPIGRSVNRRSSSLPPRRTGNVADACDVDDFDVQDAAEAIPWGPPPLLSSPAVSGNRLHAEIPSAGIGSDQAPPPTRAALFGPSSKQNPAVQQCRRLAQRSTSFR